ncbi:hypothetical protein V1512DRAFT_268447 [Lipomyces arxii]|uniref:uncharacterized protein n=1 Tax=Lipomyces arxii TaxID=56418 RepID=UPI0034CDF475
MQIKRDLSYKTVYNKYQTKKACILLVAILVQRLSTIIRPSSYYYWLVLFALNCFKVFYALCTALSTALMRYMLDELSFT